MRYGCPGGIDLVQFWVFRSLLVFWPRINKRKTDDGKHGFYNIQMLTKLA
jgi:hypothetical protein